jgi:ATP-dependent RNA helicase DDX46/PRP5
MGAIKKISLAGASNNAHTKRSFADMDDEDAPERKLVKIEMDELPPLNPEVQSGAVAGETLGDDLAAEDVPQAADGDVDMDGSGATNGAGPAAAAKAGDGSDVRVRPQDRMEIDTPATNDVAEEDEEDELDAYMRSLNAEAGLPLPDSKKPTGGLAGIDADSDDEPEPEVKAGPDDIATKEATLAEAAAKTRKKDLPPPDHSKIDYEPFRKNFYTAPLEVLDMTEKETELLRLEMDGIKIRGLDAPKPVRNWGSLGLPLACLDVIQANGWKNPTSIQAQAIPAIMSGRDVIGIAKTGSGKTVAFMLPLLRHVKDQRPATGAEGPIAVVCSPTRELAMQIYREAKAFVKAMSIKVSENSIV